MLPGPPMPVSSSFPDLHIPDVPPADWILRNALDFPDTIAMMDEDGKRSLTFLQVRTQSQSLACGLVKAGLKEEDVGAVCLPNSPEYPLIFLALASRRAIMTGINPNSTSFEIQKQLDDSSSRFIFTSPEYLAKILKASKNAKKKIEKIFVIGKKFKRSKRVRSIEELYEDASKFSSLTPVKVQTRTDVVLLPYSSGTTGLSKGVMLTHYNITALLAIAGSDTFLRWPIQGERVLAFLPFSHVYGFFTLLNSLKAGVTTITVPKFQPERYLSLIQRYEIKMLFLVPPVLIFLAKDPVVSKYDISCVDTIVVGAAPVGKELSEELLDRHPNVKFLIQGYGMTETVAIATIMLPTARERLKHGSCGLLLPNYEAKVVEPESGKEVGAEERGEIWIRSVCTMAGYLGQPQATAATVDSDRWLHTGDIGYYDEEGYFFIVDRLKELIKVRGFQVPPAELEDILLSHPDIEDAAVIGMPDKVSGELPMALIVRKDDARITEFDVEEFVGRKVANYKRLKGGVRFLDQIPRSSSGKILRRLLRDRFINQTQISKL